MKNKTSKQTKDGVIRVVLCAIVILLILLIIVINNIPEIDNTLNYWEFIYAFVGAFLGFTSSIIVDKSQSMGVEAKKRALMINNVKKELVEVKFALQKCGTNERIELEIPCYEAMVQSGFLLDCIEEDYYDEMMRAYYLCNQYITKKGQMEEHEFFIGAISTDNAKKQAQINNNAILSNISLKVIEAIESFLEE